MVFVDPLLLEQLEKAENKLVPIIISCKNDCEPIIDSLKQAGIHVTSTQSAVLGSFAARIAADQIEVLETTPGISSIEYDQEVKALH